MEARNAQDRVCCVTAEVQIEPPADPSWGGPTGPAGAQGTNEIAASPAPGTIEPVAALAELAALSPEDFLVQQAATRDRWSAGPANIQNW